MLKIAKWVGVVIQYKISNRKNVIVTSEESFSIASCILSAALPGLSVSI
jgi:hypothetical protein